MVSLLRYIRSIGVYLTMLAIGGFLCFAGVTSLLTVFALQTAFSLRPVAAGPSVGELMFETSDFGELWLQDMTPWLITFGYLVVGLPLVYFGAQGLKRRVQLGLPDEDEGLARSPVGLTVQILLSGIGLVFGLFGVVTGLFDLAEPATLYVSGHKTSAVIEREWNSTQTEDKTDSGLYASYAFETADGQTIRESTSIPSWFARKIEEGDRIEVLYDPGDASIHSLPGLYDTVDLLTYFGIQLLMIWLGVWGLRRALRAGERGEPAITVRRTRDLSTQRTRRAQPTRTRVPAD